MKKVYLLLTAICLTALTGCIKEEYTLEETAITVNVSTRATGTQSTEQGDGIQDVNVWAFKYTVNEDKTWTVTDTATAWSRVPAMEAWSSVDVHLQFKACNDTEKYILVAVINQGQFGTIKVDNETITLGRNTTYSQLTNAKFVAPNTLMGSNPGNGSGEDPDYMPISHWTTFDLTTEHAGNTHPNTCLEVPMPVYRALAKTQLLVAKSDANSTVTIKNVTLGAGSMGTDGTIISTNTYPTEGALLSAATGTYDEEKNTAGDFVAPGDTTPQWYVSSVSTTSHYNDVDATDNEVDIFDPSTTNTGAVSADLTEDEHAAATADDAYALFTPITSYFLYENAGGNGGAWNTASTNGGYYMDVTYNTGEATDKTERVWLPAVVRNHDIQVRALVNAGGKLTLTINVKDWTEQSAQLDFKDYVTFSKSITWAEGTNFDSNNNHIVQLGNARGDNATFSFQLDAPVGGTWYAELITKQGKANAFSFSNTAVETTTFGEIGKEANLTIYTTAENFGAETENVAELRITARGTIGGVERTFRVDMGTAGNYQIKQAN